ncbi:hypothetical protein N656DRAFT_830865 [Canariomyces notabilis]|uniref:Uncharacterized protein n=1 Tax=Canariomyces notabilis TaxID=2074819 RepID=A0AAN6T9W9_9PEZI|nr:hypothetical protein N656DRAFT_830865 [Canariomyces arenarius]
MVTELRNELGQLKQTNMQQAKQIRTQTADFSRELEELKSKAFFTAPKVSDTEIMKKWKVLGFSIRQFISSYLSGPLDPPTLRLLEQKQEFRWLPHIATTLQLPILRPILFESWIWHFLCFRVFDLRSSLWGGEAGKLLGSSSEIIRKLIARNSGLDPRTNTTSILAKFHDWRVHSAQFLSQFNTHDKKYSIAELSNTMLDYLKHAMTGNHFNEPDMRLDAYKIVGEAAKLDEIFRLSKADFHVFITRVKLPLVEPPSFGFHFDDQTMEITKDVPLFDRRDSADRKHIVGLAISPGIFKAGNSNGANYGTERVLVKLQALCNLQEMLVYFENQSVTHGGRHQKQTDMEDLSTDAEVDMLSIARHKH